MACFGGIIEPFWNGERLFDGAGTLLEGKGIGGDDGNEIVAICMEAAYITGHGEGNATLQYGSEISSERTGSLRNDLGYTIALSKTTVQIGKFRPITAIFKVKNSWIRLNHKNHTFLYWRVSARLISALRSSGLR